MYSSLGFFGPRSNNPTQPTKLILSTAGRDCLIPAFQRMLRCFAILSVFFGSLLYIPCKRIPAKQANKAAKAPSFEASSHSCDITETNHFFVEG